MTTDDYTGYIHYNFTDEQLTELYSNLNNNLCNLNINQYLIVHNKEGEIVDKLCWTGETLRPIKYYTFFSHYLGETKPKPNDIYQALAMDSLMNNQITMLKGPAGTGKSILSLAYLFHLLEKHKIDKIIVFCNTVATKGAAKLGYLPGTRDDKLLDSQIGNMLSSKLGDKLMVEKLIADGKLLLLPMSDVRGYDTSGMNAGIYITEAQNMDITLMKLAL
jgi:predicted ribonuclease YlaK